MTTDRELQAVLDALPDPCAIVDARLDLQLASLAKVKEERSNEEVERTLAALRQAAKAGDNVMPAIMDAVKAYATVGEMTECLVDAYGRYQEPITI